MFAVTWLPSCLASTAAACACSCCTAVTQQALRSAARAAWSLLFTLSIVAAWLARDFGPALLKKLPVRSGTGRGAASARRPRRPPAASPARRSLFAGSLPCSCSLTPWQRLHCLLCSAETCTSAARLPQWIVRRFAGDLPDDAWFGQQAVYRISMGNFVSWFGGLGAEVVCCRAAGWLACRCVLCRWPHCC